MELRKLNITFTKSGSGSLNTRLGIPISWIKKLGINESNKEIYVYEIGDKIVISKEQMKWELSNIIEIAKNEILQILEKKEYIEYREIEEIYNNIVDCYQFSNKRERNIKYHNLQSKIQAFLEKNYKLVLDEEQGYFYNKNYNFKTVEELEKNLKK